jgi:uncharacterized membrane protein (DUF2068 family)
MTAAAPLEDKSPAAPSRPGNGVLRLIGAFKLLKSLCLAIAAVAAARLIRRDADDELLSLARLLHVAPGNRLLRHLLERSFSVTHRQWAVVTSVLAAYSIMFFIEGVGLLLAEYWAEWMTVITTCGLIPFEIYEMMHRYSHTKLAAFVVNVAVAVYLIVRLSRRNPKPS